MGHRLPQGQTNSCSPWQRWSWWWGARFRLGLLGLQAVIHSPFPEHEALILAILSELNAAWSTRCTGLFRNGTILLPLNSGCKEYKSRIIGDYGGNTSCPIFFFIKFFLIQFYSEKWFTKLIMTLHHALIERLVTILNSSQVATLQKWDIQCINILHWMSHFRVNNEKGIIKTLLCSRLELLLQQAFHARTRMKVSQTVAGSKLHSGTRL